MKTMKTLCRNTLLPLVIASLTACGGGGGSSSNNADHSVSNKSGISGNEILQLLQEGLYEFDLYVDDIDSPPTLTLSRDRIGLDNDIVTVESHVTTPTGWMAESDYYASIGSMESRDLILTATGWRERAAIPCTAQPDGNAVIWDCAGNRSRLTLGTPLSIAGTPVKSELLELASHSDASANAALQDATASLTTVFDTQARIYPLTNTTEYDEAVTLNCTPTAADQPESEWSCNTDITSASWEELDIRDEAFNFSFELASGEFRSMQVFLDGDLKEASTGNIVLVIDNDGELTPDSVVGTWNKVHIHNEDIIVLTATEQRTSNSGLNALMFVNDKIVEGVYKPEGSRYTGNVYNAAAGNLLSDIGIDLFPLTFDE